MEPTIVLTPEFITLVIGMSYVWAAAYFSSLVMVPLKLALSVIEIVVQSFVSVFTPAKKASIPTHRRVR